MSFIATVRVLLVASLLLGAVQSPAADEPFVVSIPVASERSRLAHRDATSHFHVMLQNRSGDAQRVWEWWNSWGWPTLTFELSDASGKHWVANRRKDMRWSRNFPSFETIESGGLFIIDAYFGDDRFWEGFPLQKGQLKDVQMKAVFEVRASPEAEEHKIWIGRVESEPINVTFVRW